MNQTKHKPRLDAQFNEHEAVEHKGKWRNGYLFAKNGIIYGPNTYDDRKQAAKEASAVMAYNYDLAAREGNQMNFMGVILDIKTLLTVIQIPVAS